MAVPILRQVEFYNRCKSRSRRGNEADRRRAEAALWRVAKAEVFFAPKSASLRRRLPFLNTPWVAWWFRG